jgi:hypothetical protein
MQNWIAVFGTACHLMALVYLLKINDKKLENIHRKTPCLFFKKWNLDATKTDQPLFVGGTQ